MNEALQYMRTILFTRQGLLITADAYASAVFEAFPLEGIKEDLPAPLDYATKTKSAFEQLMSDTSGVSVTREYSSTDLESGTIAYHRIHGFITADSWYYFSLKQFERDLLAAEGNDAINCHFLHISSGGGEAWYLDQISAVLQSIKKPIVAFVEQSCCSAAYHIACVADIIIASTNYDRFGCIGTMLNFMNWDGYYEKLGIKHYLIRAHKSDLKNKEEEDLLAGKPESYITNFLDPLTEEFIALVKANRPSLADASDDEEALRGKVYLTDAAIQKGLVDKKMNFTQALQEAKKLGDKYDKSRDLKNEVIKLFNS